MAPLPYNTRPAGRLRQMHRYTPTIHTGDCRDMLEQLDDNSVDLILTDPPYQLGEFLTSSPPSRTGIPVSLTTAYL